NPDHELAMRKILGEVHPDAVVSISSDVLREYREYERSMTTLVDAAVKPDIRRYIANISTRLRAMSQSVGAGRDDGSGQSAGGGAPRVDGGGAFTGGGAPRVLPFFVMKSNGGVPSAEEVVHQPITTVLSGRRPGPGRRRWPGSRIRVRRDVRRWGTSTDVTVVVDGHPALITEGSIGAYPSKIPMIDVVTVGAGGGLIAGSVLRDAEGRPEVRRADPGPLCYGNGGEEPTVTDAHLLGRIPLTCSVARCRSMSTWPVGVDDLGKLDLPGRGSHRHLEFRLEPGQRAAPDHRQTRPRRPRFPSGDLGGSGSLPACRLSTYWLSWCRGAAQQATVGVRTAHRRRPQRLRAEAVTALAAGPAADSAARGRLDVPGGGGARGRGSLQTYVGSSGPPTALLGQAYEVRVPVPDGALTEQATNEVAAAFHDEHSRLYGYDFRDDDRQEVEWVNLRVTGIGPIRKPELREVSAGVGADAAATGIRQVYFDGWVETTIYDRVALGSRDVVAGPAIVEEFSSTVPVHPGFSAQVDRFGNLVMSRTPSERC
ncbi:MAG: hydantoinase/oxoprolinase family protein, partial [Nocardioidaceae bacterium]